MLHNEVEILEHIVDCLQQVLSPRFHAASCTQMLRGKMENAVLNLVLLK